MSIATMSNFWWGISAFIHWPEDAAGCGANLLMFTTVLRYMFSEALYDSVFVSKVVGDSISIFCYLSWCRTILLLSSRNPSNEHRQFQTWASLGIALVNCAYCLPLYCLVGAMGQSRPRVRTTDQSKAQWLGGGTGFFSTHKPTARAAPVACPVNLAAVKPPLPMSISKYFHSYACWIAKYLLVLHSRRMGHPAWPLLLKCHFGAGRVGFWNWMNECNYRTQVLHNPAPASSSRLLESFY